MEPRLAFKTILNGNLKLDFYDDYAILSHFKTSLFGNKEKEVWSIKIDYNQIDSLEHEEFMDRVDDVSRVVRGFTTITLYLNTYIPGINTTTPQLTFDVGYTKSNGNYIGITGNENDCRSVGRELDIMAQLIKQ